jgi:hypothetical protein
MRTRFLAAAALVVLALSACVSVPPSENEGRVVELIELINDGSVEELVGQSHAPVFFDAELVVRRADIELMWSGLKDAGFEVSPVGFALEPATSSDFRRVADTFDMESFFSPDGFFPDDAGWVIVDSSAGQLMLLIGGSSGSLPLIFGIARVR